MMKWSNLTEAQLVRLAECRSYKSDIVPIATAYMIEKGYDPETALEVTIDHLEWNSQDFDLSREEWLNAISDLETAKRYFDRRETV